MKKYKVVITADVELDAFNLEDALEAIKDAIGDTAGDIRITLKSAKYNDQDLLLI